MKHYQVWFDAQEDSTGLVNFGIIGVVGHDIFPERSYDDEPQVARYPVGVLERREVVVNVKAEDPHKAGQLAKGLVDEFIATYNASEKYYKVSFVVSSDSSYNTFVSETIDPFTVLMVEEGKSYAFIKNLSLYESAVVAFNKGEAIVKAKQLLNSNLRANL